MCGGTAARITPSRSDRKSAPGKNKPRPWTSRGARTSRSCRRSPARTRRTRDETVERPALSRPRFGGLRARRSTCLPSHRPPPAASLRVEIEKELDLLFHLRERPIRWRARAFDEAQLRGDASGAERIVQARTLRGGDDAVGRSVQDEERRIIRGDPG